MSAIAALRGWPVFAASAPHTPAVLSGTHFDLTIDSIACQLHGPSIVGHGGERVGSRPDAAMARRRYRHPGGDEPHEEIDLDPLARRSRARRYGWSSGSELSRHRAGRDVRLSLSSETERDVLVPQPHAVSGTDRLAWRADHRTAVRRSDRIRPGIRRDADRLDGYESRNGLQQPEGRKRILQLPPADGRHLLFRCEEERTSGGPFPTG